MNSFKELELTLDGYFHSLGDLPAMIRPNGTKFWYQHGEIHRDYDDLPAVIYANGSKYWYQHGDLHRLTGPAVEFSDGEVRYWIEGEELSKEQFKERIRCLKSTK